MRKEVGIRKIKNTLSVQDKASITYLAANIITKGLNFISLPIFTRLLTTQDMGVVTIFNSWQNIVYVIITLSLTSGSLNVGLMKYKNDRNKYLATIQTIITVIVGICIFGSLFFRNELSSLLGISYKLIITLFLYSLFNPAIEGWYAKNRYEYKYIGVALVTIISAVLSLIVSVFAVYFARPLDEVNLGEVKIISQTVVIIAFALFFYILNYIKSPRLFDKNMAKYSVVLSLPLIIHSLAKNILDISDRLMIDRYCGKSKAGIYGTVYTISTMSLIVWTAINNALVPDMFEKLSEEKYVDLEARLRKILMLFSCIAVLMTLFGPEVLSIITTSEYREGLFIIPAVSAGIYFTALYNIYGNVILFKEKSNYLSFATAITAGINIVTNYIFINKFGYIAAAYTTLFSFIVLAIMQGIQHKKLIKRHVCSFRFVAFLSTMVVVVSLLCNVLYFYTAIRYAIITILALILIYKRKEIQAIF